MPDTSESTWKCGVCGHVWQHSDVRPNPCPNCGSEKFSQYQSMMGPAGANTIGRERA